MIDRERKRLREEWSKTITNMTDRVYSRMLSEGTLREQVRRIISNSFYDGLQEGLRIAIRAKSGNKKRPHQP